MSQYDPQEYFDYIKSKTHGIDDQKLAKAYEAAEYLISKYQKTGQREAMKKLLFQLEVIERERQIIKLGIDKFVYRDDIDEYIDDVAKNVVKIIELERYEREIPDEIVEVIEATRQYFDAMYVVFTDYTGKVGRKVEKERREKDPILFGTFEDDANKVLINRFYYLGDWVDDYCDLTLEKMVSEMQKQKNRGIVVQSYTPEDIDGLRKQVGMLEENKGSMVVNPNKSGTTFFQKVKSVLKGKRRHETKR